MGQVIDFHCHILPGIDDGSATVEESIAMLRAAAEQGIGFVVATPHFYPVRQSPDVFLERRDRAERKLRQEMEKYPNLPALEIGAEVAYYSGMSESESLSCLAIRGTSYILIELPPAPWPGEVWRELQGIRERHGLTPIIAHIDRYIHPLCSYGIPAKMADMPVLVQANASFFLNRWTSRYAMKLLKKGQIHVLGSDCHNMTDRAPNLGPALSKIKNKLGREFIMRIMERGCMVLEDTAENGVV